MTKNDTCERIVLMKWLTLWTAIFGDMGATLIVTLDNLRLLQVKDDEQG